MKTTIILLTLGVLFNIWCLIKADKIENYGK